MIEFFCTDKGRDRRVVLGKASAFTGNVMGRDMYLRDAPDRPFWGPDGEWLGGVRPGEFGKRIKDGKLVLSPYVKAHFAHTADGDLDLTKEPLWEFLCPKCGRNPQINGDLFRDAMAGLIAAGITEVDISRLPF